jgi:hypothetical protein
MAVFDHRLLLDRMRRAWNHGDRLALGWTAVPGSLRVLMVERSAFLSLCRARPNLRSDGRYQRPAMLCDLGAELGTATRLVEVVLVERVDAAVHARMESVVERFTLGLAPRQPVALVDLVGFSKLGPMDQRVRLASLEQRLCRAEAALERASFGFTPLRTTTGDGFYLWYPRRDTADAARLLALVLSTFLEFEVAGRDAGFDAGDLKATLGIGACFTFHRIAEQTPQDDTFIGGAVTVEIARLMAACRPGQILLGTGPQHRRLATWRAAIRDLKAALGHMERGTDRRLLAKLTGSRNDDGGAKLDRYTVRAKHGRTYPAVNMCAEALIAHDRPVPLGLADPHERAAA